MSAEAGSALDNQRQFSDSELERSWPGGPLRKIGTGHGTSSKYVCGVCRRSVVGIHRLEARGAAQETWVCEGCRRQARYAVAPKEKQR